MFSVLVLAAIALGETHGYLSFHFAKGQEESGLSQGTFQSPLLGLFFSGDLTPRLAYISEIGFRDDSRLEIEQALLGIRLGESFTLNLGLYLVPFGKYNVSHRPHQTALIKTPLHVESLYPSRWRDVGVIVEGKTGGFFYSAYLGNGLTEAENLSRSQQFTDHNKDKGKGGRVGLFLGRGLEAAFSYYRGKYDEDNERALSLKGADLSLISGGIQILSEYAVADVENPAPYAKGKAEGYFVQVSIDIEAIRPVASYQRLKYRDPFHGTGLAEGIPEGIDEEKSRWTFGLVYFASSNVLFKAEYELNREREAKLRNDIFLIQMALHF